MPSSPVAVNVVVPAVKVNDPSHDGGEPVRVDSGTGARSTPVMVDRGLALVDAPESPESVVLLKYFAWNRPAAPLARCAGAGVANPVNGATFEVGVEQVAARPRLEVDGVRRSADEELSS